MVEARPTGNDGNEMNVAKSIAETLLYRPFYVMVLNMSDMAVTLPKFMRIATPGEPPSNIVLV